MKRVSRKTAGYPFCILSHIENIFLNVSFGRVSFPSVWGIGERRLSGFEGRTEFCGGEKEDSAQKTAGKNRNEVGEETREKRKAEGNG